MKWYLYPNYKSSLKLNSSKSKEKNRKGPKQTFHQFLFDDLESWDGGKCALRTNNKGGREGDCRVAGSSSKQTDKQ